MSTRAAETRAALLAAAARVFVRTGYHDASVADVVAEAEASVGSLYHHFGAKSDLYAALFEAFARRQEARSALAVRDARAQERSSLEQFEAGTRAYLAGCRSERGLVRLFHTGDGPPGFETVRRRRYRDWLHANHALLRAPYDPTGDALVLVLTTVLSEAGHEIALAEDEPSAAALTEEVLRLVGRITGDRPLS